MNHEIYTPGASQNASDFMARRTIESHGQFFLSHLTPGVSVLDCGCGPGTISLSIAERIAPGRLLAIQLDRAGDSASAATIQAWSRSDDGMFAQCWVSCVARKPVAYSTSLSDDRT